LNGQRWRNDTPKCALSKQGKGEIFGLHFFENQTLKPDFESSVFVGLNNSQDFGAKKPFQEKFG
jgi:hypothetical protein